MLPKILWKLDSSPVNQHLLLFVSFSLGDACSTTGVFPKLAKVSFHTGCYYFCFNDLHTWSALVKVLLKTQLGLSYKL